MTGTDMPYSAKEVIEKINIGDSTLRKWCLTLEKQNYNFIRTDQHKRLFTEKDVFVLSQFKVLVQDKNLSMNNAAAVIVSKYTNEVFSNETKIEQVTKQPVQQVFSNETVLELKTEMEQLKSMNNAILEMLKEQKNNNEELKNYIQNEFEEDRKQRQHTIDIATSLKESMEQQKLLAAEQEEEKKKGFWSRLFAGKG